MKKLALLGIAFLLYLNFAISRRARNRNIISTEPPDTKIADKPRETLGPDTESAVFDDETPRFTTKAEEVKWKLNQARKTLNVARQYVQLAATYAKVHKVNNSKHVSVKDLIGKTEKVLLHAGDRLGLDYMHFKRSVDEEPGKE